MQRFLKYSVVLFRLALDGPEVLFSVAMLIFPASKKNSPPPGDPENFGELPASLAGDH